MYVAQQQRTNDVDGARLGGVGAVGDSGRRRQAALFDAHQLQLVKRNADEVKAVEVKVTFEIANTDCNSRTRCVV